MHDPLRPEIRRAAPADAPALARFAAETFAEAFGADNRPDDMADYLASAFGESIQAREIADPAIGTWLACDGEALAGYAQTWASTPPGCVRARPALEIRRFYVGAAWRGTGLAARLMHRIGVEARDAGVVALWLGVWNRNGRAQAFYRRFGFARVGAQTFALSRDLQRDDILVAAVASVIVAAGED